MTPHFWLNVLIVVASTLLSSWCWIVYIRAAKANPVRAALADCGLLALQMVNVVSYVEDRRLAIPVLLSAFVGTFFAVRKP